jgi:hypothetical protein
MLVKLTPYRLIMKTLVLANFNNSYLYSSIGKEGVNKALLQMFLLLFTDKFMFKLFKYDFFIY